MQPDAYPRLGSAGIGTMIMYSVAADMRKTCKERLMTRPIISGTASRPEV